MIVALRAACVPFFRSLAMLVALSLSSPAAAQTSVSSLDPQHWNLCEAFPDQIVFGEDQDKGALRDVLSIAIDQRTVGRDWCAQVPSVAGSQISSDNIGGRPSAPGADLGPSLVGPESRHDFGLKLDSFRDCPKGEPPVERNELRFKDGSDMIRSWSEPTWYSLTFRMSGQIYPCGSARWVIGQWKQWTRANESPVLAQRFDNGVLHVTVQNGDCRCVIAKASGDFDQLVFAGILPRPKQQLSRSHPIKCLDSRQSTADREVKCRPEEPLDLQIFTMGGAAPPALPDGRSRPVTLTYLVKGGSDGLVDVYANGRFIVRAAGRLGYDNTTSDLVKFKIGQYRDAIPGTASLKIDRLCVSTMLAECEPGLRPIAAR